MTTLRIFANSSKRASQLARQTVNNPKSAVKGYVVSRVKLKQRPINADDKKTYVATLRKRK